MSDEVVIRALTLTDLPAVAEIHLAAFPDQALTRLGKEAVRRYYEWQLSGPHDAAALGAFRGGACVGFCFGGVFRGALTGFLRRNRTFLVWRMVRRPWLLASPLVRDRLRSALRLLGARPAAPARVAVSPEAPERRPAFGILAIAVHPSAQGTGAGRRLMDISEQAAQERGFTEMDLTVHPENSQAVRFYEKLGWARAPDGEVWRGSMRKNILG